jgi:hypothetical protein
VAFEAAYGWGWLVDLLEELDLQPHLVHPSRCKAIASARLKDDRVDAHTLAHLPRADLLPEAWIAPKQCVTSVPCYVIGHGWDGCGRPPSAGSTRSWPTAASASSDPCGPIPVVGGWLALSCHHRSARSSTTAWP